MPPTPDQLVVEPEVDYMWMHNNGILHIGYIALFWGGVGMLLFGFWPVGCVAICFSLMFRVMRNMLCGWVHTWTAYAMSSESHKVTFEIKN